MVVATGAYAAPASAAPSLSEQGCPGDACTATYTADGPTGTLIVGRHSGNLTFDNYSPSVHDWAFPAACSPEEFLDGLTIRRVIACPGGRYRVLVLNVASADGAPSWVSIESAFASVTFNGGAGSDRLDVRADANVVAHGNGAEDSLLMWPGV